MLGRQPGPAAVSHRMLGSGGVYRESRFQNLDPRTG